jgi:hypothetical protein
LFGIGVAHDFVVAFVIRSSQAGVAEGGEGVGSKYDLRAFANSNQSGHENFLELDERGGTSEGSILKT